MLDQNARDLMATMADLERRLQIQERNENQIWKGSAFPTTGLYDRRKYTRSDRDIEYFYDLANTRWLSTELIPMSLLSSSGASTLLLTATTPQINSTGRTEEVYDLYFTKMVFVTYENGATYDASNNYVFELFRSDSSNVATTMGSVSNWITGRSSLRRYTNVLTVNSQQSLNNSLFFYVNATKVGAASNCYVDFPFTLWYRLVG